MARHQQARWGGKGAGDPPPRLPRHRVRRQVRPGRDREGRRSPPRPEARGPAREERPGETPRRQRPVPTVAAAEAEEAAVAREASASTGIGVCARRRPFHGNLLLGRGGQDGPDRGTEAEEVGGRGCRRRESDQPVGRGGQEGPDRGAEAEEEGGRGCRRRESDQPVGRGHDRPPGGAAEEKEGQAHEAGVAFPRPSPLRREGGGRPNREGRSRCGGALPSRTNCERRGWQQGHPLHGQDTSGLGEWQLLQNSLGYPRLCLGRRGESGASHPW